MRPAAGPTETDIGLLAYATRTPPLGGRLKVRVEDFTVDEVAAPPLEDAAGRFAAARVRLVNWDTHLFVREASARLGVSRNKIRFSGTKDKRGVTEQWFTFEAPTDALTTLTSLPGVELREVRRTRQESALGQHVGNRFRVVLRDVAVAPHQVPEIMAAALGELGQVGGAPNFFGPQRFGSSRASTHLVGERMLRGDFTGAVRVYLSPPGASREEGASAAWRTAVDGGDWKAALALASPGQRFERALLHRLVETDGDGVAALRALPDTLQRLFVHAYQSLLFNRILSRRIQDAMPVGDPVVGDLVVPLERGRPTEEFVPVDERNLERCRAECRRGRAAVTGLLPGTEVQVADGPMGRIEEQVLREAGAQARDFLVPEMLEWSSKGTRRPLAASVAAAETHIAPDEVFPGRTQVEFRFTLPAGSYATAVLREFMKSPVLAHFG